LAWAPHICNGPIALHFSHFRFALRLRLRLSALEGGDLSLELVIEFLQCLLFKNDVLMIESHLLPIVIRPGLLFLHLLLHFSEHIKNVDFAQ